MSFVSPLTSLYHVEGLGETKLTGSLGASHLKVPIRINCLWLVYLFCVFYW